MFYRRSSRSRVYGASVISTVSPQITTLCTFRFLTRLVNTSTVIQQLVRSHPVDKTVLLYTVQVSDVWIMWFRRPRPKVSRSSCHYSTIMVTLAASRLMSTPLEATPPPFTQTISRRPLTEIMCNSLSIVTKSRQLSLHGNSRTSRAARNVRPQ